MQVGAGGLASPLLEVSSGMGRYMGPTHLHLGPFFLLASLLATAWCLCLDYITSYRIRNKMKNDDKKETGACGDVVYFFVSPEFVESCGVDGSMLIWSA